MSKKKDKKKIKKSKFDRICEICGNEQFSFSPVFKCRFCGETNGVKREDEKQEGKNDNRTVQIL